MYNFHILEGKKLISYKPTKEHYLLAIVRCIDKAEGEESISIKGWKAKYPENFKHYLYLAIKLIPKLFDYRKKYTSDEVGQWFDFINYIDGMIALLTPRELMQMFPITKEYDGKKYGMKDYFFTMNVIDQMGVDNLIGDPYSFLFDYMNTDTQIYMCTWTAIINRGYQAQGGRDILLDFFEEQGMPLPTYHEENGYLVNDKNGEKFKIEKPKNKLKKLFSVV